MLGVAPTATDDEIRRAYRELARRHHPDRNGAATSLEMARINAAYRSLRTVELRADYDRSQRSSSAVPRAAPSPSVPRTRPATPRMAPPPPSAGPRFPWGLVGLMAGVGIGVVIAGAAFYEPSAPPPHDQVIEAGSCVFVQGTGSVLEVDCDAADARRVRSFVPLGEPCPTGTLGYSDRLGRGLACVEPAR